MKFRATESDIKKVGIMSVVILYISALIVLNISTFASEGEFYGFNPIEAFTGELLAPTFVLFFSGLIALFASTSSSVFQREKGLGITTKKKEDGYTRFMTDKEMKKELKLVNPLNYNSEIGGIPLINTGKKIWVDDGEYHNLIIGATGSGKTEMIVQPMIKMLAKKGESMIITDPKGEIYENSALELKERGYNVVVLNFREPQKGSAWNPLTLPYSLHKQGNKDKANELLDDLALNILYDEKASGQDPFWEKTSADYFTGISLGLFDDAEEEQINLNSINLMTTVGEDKCGPSNYIKEYFNSKDPTSAAFINAASTINAPSDTKGSILSVFKQKIKLFSSRENISEMLSHSDIDLRDIGRKKTAVFLVIQDEKKTYHSLVTIFIKQCYETLIDVAQENGGKLAYKTNFILDEFANMPPLKDVTTMVTAARSRKIRFTFIIQNFAQLTKVYGKEDAETIRGNCGNLIYLISSELAALEEISKMCGEVKSKEKDKTSSTPLVTISDLQRIPQWTVILLRMRKMPYKTKMTPNWMMLKKGYWGKEYGKAPFIERERKQVQTFDVKNYVDEMRKAKQKDMGGMFNQGFPGMPNPMGFPGMPPMNPFMQQDKKASAGVDYDDLLKRIDSKIAEIEEEERREKEKSSNIEITDVLEETTSDDSVIVTDVEKEIMEEDKISDILEETVNNEPIVEIDSDNENLVKDEQTDKKVIDKETKQNIENKKEIEAKIIPKKNIENDKLAELEAKFSKKITDDQFFDDFFDDDE